MPLNTNLASSHDQESSLPSADHELDFLDNSLIPNNSFVHNHSFPHDPSFAPAPDNSFPQNDFFSHNNSFPQDNSIDIPTSLTISHPTTSQQYTPPHMLQSDTHMDPTISTPSSSNNLSISHLLPSTGYDTEWYGGDPSLTLSNTDNQHNDGTLQDNGIPHFPTEHVPPAEEINPHHHLPLDVILPVFAFLLDLYLPQVRSLVFLVDNTDAAFHINQVIQELHHHPFRGLAGISRLSGRTGNSASTIAGFQWGQLVGVGGLLKKYTTSIYMFDCVVL